MQFTTALLTALLAASSTLAAPSPLKGAAAAKTWTLTSFTRTCNGADTSCKYTFGIDGHDGKPVVACTYTVTAGSEASRANGGPAACGRYIVTSGWSGQFDVGFTTLAVKDEAAGLIAFPAYTDPSLVNGKAVVPDLSPRVETWDF